MEAEVASETSCLIKKLDNTRSPPPKKGKNIYSANHLALPYKLSFSSLLKYDRETGSKVRDK
jgi:hypothetical protein